MKKKLNLEFINIEIINYFSLIESDSLPTAIAK
jgi:hypothetical protein